MQNIFNVMSSSFTSETLEWIRRWNQIYVIDHKYSKYVQKVKKNNFYEKSEKCVYVVQCEKTKMMMLKNDIVNCNRQVKLNAVMDRLTELRNSLYKKYSWKCFSGIHENIQDIWICFRAKWNWYVINNKLKYIHFDGMKMNSFLFLLVFVQNYGYIE